MDLEMDTPGSGPTSRGSISLRTDVYFLPEFYSNSQLAGRSDQNSGRRKVGSLSDTQDLEGTVRKLATGPGAYFAECRAGRDVVDSDVFELKPKGQSLEIESSRSTSATPLQPSPAPQIAQQTEASSAQSINATTETIRATKELLREVAPPPAQPSALQLSKEEIEQIAERAAAKVQPIAAPADFITTFRQVLSIQKELAPPAPAMNSQPPKDFITEAAEKAEQYKTLKDVFGGSESSVAAGEGISAVIVHETFGLVRSFVPVLQQLAPMLLARAQQRPQQQQHSQPNGMHPQGMSAMPPPATDAPQMAQGDLPESLNALLQPSVIAVLEIIGTDVLNYEPDDENEISEAAWHSCDAIFDAIDSDATGQVGMSLQAMLNPLPSEICKLISGQAGLAIPGMEHMRVTGFEYIARKKDADSFFRELKTAVQNTLEERSKEQPNDEEMSAAPVSANGNGAHTGAAVVGQA